MRWIQASEKLPKKVTDDLSKDKAIIFANTKRTAIMYVYLSITPNIPALIQNDLNGWEWLDESPSEQSSTVGVEEPDEKWFIHEGIEFSKKIKTDSESYKLGTGFGYSCGLQDGYKKFASLSEGEEAIGFAEWVSEATGMTENHIYIDRNPFGIGGGYYTVEQLYNIYKQSKK